MIQLWSKHRLAFYIHEEHYTKSIFVVCCNGCDAVGTRPRGEGWPIGWGRRDKNDVSFTTPMLCENCLKEVN